MSNYYNTAYNRSIFNPTNLVSNNQLMNAAIFGDGNVIPIESNNHCKNAKCNKCQKSKKKSQKNNKCIETECNNQICPVISYNQNIQIPSVVTTWKKNYLVSNEKSRATHYDVSLIQPRGLAIHQNQLWVANTMSDKITNYDLFGNALLGSIQVRQNDRIVTFPTSLAINCGNGFVVPSVTAGGRSALLVTATKTGDICIFNPCIDGQNTFVVYTNREIGEVAEYTGLIIVDGILYLADFYNGKIDVFDSSFNRILGFRFVDDYSADPIPISYGPHNIAYIAPYIYIIYAQRQPGAVVHHVIGPGTGYISVFNRDGSFVRRLCSRGALNTPWSIIPAPCVPGIPPGSFLVGNVGDSKINIFTGAGEYVGPLIAQDGTPLKISGLQAIAANYTSVNEIFFTASEDIETFGLLGSIVPDKVIDTNCIPK